MEVLVEFQIITSFDVLPDFGTKGFKDVQPAEFPREDMPVANLLAFVHEDTGLPDAEAQSLVGGKMPVEGCCK